jgi:ABC-type lipoprotein export system ATPase subunit
MSGRHAAPEPEADPVDLELDYRGVDEAPPAAPIATRPIVATTLSADGVGYVRAGRTILDAVSVTATAGEALAVVGPSGSGKSSLLALLAGLEAPDSGTIRRQPPSPPARDGLILQGYGLVSVLTAAENVEAPLQAGVLGRLGRAEIRARSAAALDAVGLGEVADHLVEELSGGQQQRVAIARALAVDPPIVLADEPTAELDHESKQHVVELLLDVAARGGVVVIATHDEEIAERCARQVRLVDGRVAPPT